MITSGLIAQLVIFMVVLLFSISAHEAAHAWMSNRFGDDTARLLGRITLNPVAHTDPIGTLLIPIASFILSHVGASIALVGWGKPTPVNPLRWRNKDLANVMVSIAGILANLLIAIVALGLMYVAHYLHLFGEDAVLSSIEEPLVLFLFTAYSLNVALAFFNLLPFPPLDGSKVLYTILPDSMKPAIEALERFGFIILLLAMQTGIFGTIFWPIQRVMLSLLPTAVYPALNKIYG
ncbi:MAG TPA: site-2 protease family protein [Pyrinomonadaceae bacterium]|nr:site-2 protease family protein [Pyrinomonadaceae bacterium]